MERQNLLGHRRSADRHRAASRRMAMELRASPASSASPIFSSSGGSIAIPKKISKLTEAERGYIENSPRASDATQTRRRADSRFGASSASARCLALRSAWAPTTMSFICCLLGCQAIFPSRCISICCTRFCTPACPGSWRRITDFVVGGWLVDFLVQRGWNASRVRRVVLIGGTAFGLGILGAAPCAHCGAGADLDQHLDRRTVCGIAGRLVGAVADRRPQRCGQGGRHHQFLRPDFGHLRADPHRISGLGAALLCMGLRRGGGLPAIGIAGYIFLLGKIERCPSWRLADPVRRELK